MVDTFGNKYLDTAHRFVGEDPGLREHLTMESWKPKRTWLAIFGG